MTDPYFPPPQPGPFEPIYEDDDCIILEKPSGLLSVPGRGEEKQDCLSERARLQFKRALIVHRLDMETSGLMLFARHGDAQRKFSKLFEDRKVDKTYFALAAGHLGEDTGQITLPLTRDWPNRPKQKVDPDTGKPAETQWSVVSRDAEWTKVSLKPVTGRTHQLRVHMAAVGHPLLGDNLYGERAVTSPIGRLCLHASVLAFEHPFSGDRIEVTSPPPF